MIRFAGSVKGKSRHPYIYAIAKGFCLYIGETQRLPVSRWGQHISEEGSFMLRLKDADEDLWMSDEDILFIGVGCEQIALIPPEEHKLVSQYIEHKVHECCILNKPLLSTIEKIISNTQRTAPARCRYPWANELANEVFEEILAQLAARQI